MQVKTVDPENIDDQTLNNIFSFCKKCELDSKRPASANMAYTDWENKNNTLLYLLLKTDRFKSANGIFSFLYDENNEIVASSGSYKADFDPNVVIGAVRAWKMPKYRGSIVVAEHIMPIHIDWAKKEGAKVFALTFNEYNKRVMMSMNRQGKYEKIKDKYFLFGSLSSTFYREFIPLPYKALIQNTEQYVIYRNLVDGYNPNWPQATTTSA
jgi:hypothetical protein